MSPRKPLSAFEDPVVLEKAAAILRQGRARRLAAEAAEAEQHDHDREAS